MSVVLDTSLLVGAYYAVRTILLDDVTFPEHVPQNDGVFRPVNVIAECKRRSPSRGVLRAAYDAVEIARYYERGGAAAGRGASCWRRWPELGWQSLRRSRTGSTSSTVR